MLRRRWEQSKAGHGQVVLLSGEAGIGKSALVEGLRAQVRAEGMRRIAFRCSPYHTTSALYPVITHIERLLQFEPEDPPATRLAKLEAGLRPYPLPLAEMVPLLAGLLSVPLPAEALCAADGDAAATEAADAGHAGGVAGSRGRAAAGTGGMGRLALGRSHDVGGARAGHRAGTHRGHAARADLPSGVQPALASTLWHDSSRPQPAGAPAGRGADRPPGGGKTLPVEVVQHVVAKTDGVPLYVEELTKMLLVSPCCGKKRKQYVLTGPRSAQWRFQTLYRMPSWPGWINLRRPRGGTARGGAGAGVCL